MIRRWLHLRRHRASEGTQARVQAERDLAQAVARRGEVKRLAASLRELRAENHFVERIDRMFQGRA